jgi:hypothetical protein
MTLLKIGSTYKHYSGKLYKVIGQALHSETLEPYVIYQPLYDNIALNKNPGVDFFIRPREMFCEEVEIEGKKIPRFTLLEDLPTT